MRAQPVPQCAGLEGATEEVSLRGVAAGHGGVVALSDGVVGVDGRGIVPRLASGKNAVMSTDAEVIDGAESLRAEFRTLGGITLPWRMALAAAGPLEGPNIRPRSMLFHSPSACHLAAVDPTLVEGELIGHWRKLVAHVRGSDCDTCNIIDWDDPDTDADLIATAYFD